MRSSRSVLGVGEAVSAKFHSKLDKRDTIDGWKSVSKDSAGVPYSALLYQRYVGGVWRQVQDAYSEIKGDNLAELPLAAMVDAVGVSYSPCLVPFHRPRRSWIRLPP
jgi:hypothetical protein